MKGVLREAMLPGVQNGVASLVKKLVLALALLGLCGCGSVARLTGQAGASPSPIPSPLSTADLKYRLVATVGTPFTCGLTQGPAVRVEDAAEIANMVAALRAQDPAEFDAIVRHEHLDATRLSPADNLRVAEQANMLDAVVLTAQGSGYGFSYELVGPPTAEVTGTVDAAGTVDVASKRPAPRRLCPL
jgi:hypothetical protein